MPQRVRRAPIIRYRCHSTEDAPSPGTILMGEGKRVRRAYRILSATRTRNSAPMLGAVTWKLSVEPMSAAKGREEIDAGHPWWPIVWDRRG
jgi:hypothetical protein